MQEQHILLATREEFVAWAHFCFDKLGRRASNYLNDGSGAGRNRASVVLAAKQRFNMVLARKLQIEIIADAKRLGVEIPPLLPVPEAGNSDD
jgi:hypothetical protein